jgi:hypothetical protein
LYRQDILNIGCEDNPSNNVFTISIKSSELLNITISNITPTFEPFYIANGIKVKSFAYSSWSQIRGWDNVMKVVISRVDTKATTKVPYTIAARCGDFLIHSDSHRNPQTMKQVKGN